MDWIAVIIGFLIGMVSSLIANYMSPPFSQWATKLLGRVSMVINPDRFDLSGTWTLKYSEPEIGDVGETVEEIETITISHIGNRISGESKTQNIIRNFKYSCSVKHNLLQGSYTKVAEKGNISGHGLIQMIISPDRLSMEGQVTWFDQDTNKIESSSCGAEKVG